MSTARTRVAQRLRSLRGDRGASSVEYGLIVFAIAATMVTALFALGPPVKSLFDTSCQTFEGARLSAGQGSGTTC